MKTRIYSILSMLLIIQTVSCANKPANIPSSPSQTVPVPGWQSDYESILKKLQQCHDLPDSNTCKSIVYYELGFLFENAYDTTSQNLLDSAEYYYKANLSLFPNDRTTRDRLVEIYQLKNQQDSAISLLKELYREYPAYGVTYALQLSNIYYNLENYKEAYSWAKTSTEVDPYHEGAWKNLVLTIDANSIDFEEVKKLSYAAINYGFFNQSLQLIELFINKKYNSSDLNEPLLHWCNILFDAESDYISRLDRLPSYETWSNPVVSQIKQMFELNDKEKISVADLQNLDFLFSKKGYQSPDGQKFRYEIILQFLDKSAKKWMYSNLAIAENRYDVGLKMIKELNIESYEYTGTYFDFVTSMADIYLNYPNLDPENKKINQLTNTLFSGKGEAYRDNNPEIIKRFHITLGLIYAQLNIWQSSFFPANAKFQLEHALGFKEDNEYMPLVHELLGNGYLNQLTNTYQHEQKAMQQYLMAAEDYLNLDALIKAENNLNIANANKSLLYPSGESTLDALLKVYEMRMRSRNAPIAEDSKYIISIDDDITAMNTYPLSASFKKFQAFKIYCEAGNRLQQNSKEQLYCYKKALDISRTLDHLPAYSDLLKIEQISQTIRSQIQTTANSFTYLNKIEGSDNYKTVKNTDLSIIYNAPDATPITLHIDPGLFEVSDVLYYFKKQTDSSLVPAISYFNKQLIIQDNQVDSKMIEDIRRDLDKEISLNLKIRKSY